MWTLSLIYVVRISHCIMPLFPDIMNRAGVSFHVCWWKVTINQTCFWDDCKTSVKLDSQSKNVLVEWLWLHHVGAAKQAPLREPPLPTRASLQRVAAHFPRGWRMLRMHLEEQATLRALCASTAAPLSRKRVTGTGIKGAWFSS